MKFHSKRTSALAALALTAAVALAGCGGDDEPSGGSGGGETTVTFLPKNLGNPYFDVTARGGEEGCRRVRRHLRPGRSSRTGS